MALLHDDLFSNEIVDDPEDLDLLVDGRAEADNVNSEQPTGDNSDKDEKKDDKPEKNKRKQSQRPRLNILRLMDNDIGLMAAERMFKDVKFRGKGHELDDLNLIMKKMEIWAHKLYPSFDFDDCLAKLEKLGNTRNVATYVKKLRMGLEDDIVAPQHDDDDEDNDNANDENGENQVPPRADSPGRFDQLIRNQPQDEPTQGGLTEEQRERMRRNRLIAEQRRMARLKALQEKQESATVIQPDNTVPNESLFDNTSHKHTSNNSHSQQNNPSELQNTSNIECSTVESVDSQFEKPTSGNSYSQENTPMELENKLNKESVESTDSMELESTLTNECPNVVSTNLQIEKDSSLDTDTHVATKDNDGNNETCLESQKAIHDSGTINKESPKTDLPESSYDFFEPMDDIEMAELP